MNNSTLGDKVLKLMEESTPRFKLELLEKSNPSMPQEPQKNIVHESRVEEKKSSDSSVSFKMNNKFKS